jgi:hypothetical protein
MAEICYKACEMHLKKILEFKDEEKSKLILELDNFVHDDKCQQMIIKKILECFLVGKLKKIG